MYKIKIEKRASRFIAKLSHRERSLIFVKLDALKINPYKNNLDIKKLKGGTGNEYRLRVRDFRIICKILNKELIILVIDANLRKDIYR
ncbi:MAG: type II toxin-antitoxin system RelE/ParE family toxin [Ignavibacteria bacterium]|nr:type II toxin-antitoxin system RelE/ParE family toxin [Ignavibacteria bacterium]